MSRLWTAVILLSVIVIGSVAEIFAVNHAIADITAPLETAAAAAQTEDFDTAEHALSLSHEQYLRKETLFSILLSDTLLLEVRLQFARSQADVTAQDAESLQSDVAALTQALENCRRTQSLLPQALF